MLESHINSQKNTNMLNDLTWQLVEVVTKYTCCNVAHEAVLLVCHACQKNQLCASAFQPMVTLLEQPCIGAHCKIFR